MHPKEKTARHIVGILHAAGFEAYFAGGCVRDRIRRIDAKDFDIATSATPDQVQELFKKTIPVGVHFGVIIVMEDDVPFEVATFRSEGSYKDGRHPEEVKFTTVEEDASRRDFTVNGLYYDVRTEKVVDFVGGLADIEKKIIRTIGNPEQRFKEDHLRMLRAARFSVQLGFEIDPATFAAIQKLAPKIQNISTERIRDELTKILISPSPAKGIRLLDSMGLLEHILPEMITMKGVEQPPQYHPEGDVYVHTLMLLEGMKPNPEMELAYACLLHDVAKPATFERAPDRIRFNGHDKLGAEMSEGICKRLALSNAQTQLICELVREHLRFKDVFKMRQSTLKRFLGLPRFDLHMELHRLDCMASHKLMDAYNFCKEKLEEFSKLPPPPLKIVTGADLIRMGFRPGPDFSKIIRAVEDEILEGNIKTKEEAIALVKDRFQKRKA